VDKLTFTLNHRGNRQACYCSKVPGLPTAFGIEGCAIKDYFGGIPLGFAGAYGQHGGFHILGFWFVII
jgi:hypothetical protein